MVIEGFKGFRSAGGRSAHSRNSDICTKVKNKSSETKKYRLIFRISGALFGFFSLSIMIGIPIFLNRNTKSGRKNRIRMRNNKKIKILLRTLYLLIMVTIGIFIWSYIKFKENCKKDLKKEKQLSTITPTITQ